MVKHPDFLRKNIPKREIEIIQKMMERRRKLSAEDYWEIVNLRDNQCLSWSQIARRLQKQLQIPVSKRAVTKGYKKTRKALATSSRMAKDE